MSGRNNRMHASRFPPSPPPGPLSSRLQQMGLSLSPPPAPQALSSKAQYGAWAGGLGQAQTGSAMPCLFPNGIGWRAPSPEPYQEEEVHEEERLPFPNAYTPHNIHHNIGGGGATGYAAPQGGFGEPAAPASASDYVADMLQKLNTSGACPTGHGWAQVSGGYLCAAGTHFMSDSDAHERFHNNHYDEVHNEWTHSIDPASGRIYFIETRTGRSVWKLPVQEYDEKGALSKVHAFFGTWLPKWNQSFPATTDYCALCPNYFQNVRQVLYGGIEEGKKNGGKWFDPTASKYASDALLGKRCSFVPTPGKLDTTAAQYAANALLPYGCEICKNNGGLQCALHLFIRRVLLAEDFLSDDVLAMGIGVSGMSGNFERLHFDTVVTPLTEWITQCGVNVGVITASGRTALHQLAVNGSALSIALVDVILDAASRQDSKQRLLDIKDYEGFSALEIAVDQGNVEIAAKLISSGAGFCTAGLLRRKLYDKDKWKPVTDAVVQQVQHKNWRLFFQEMFGFIPELVQRQSGLPGENDAEVVNIMHGKFKPSSPPSLNAVRKDNAEFTVLMRAIALTRFPRHCPFVHEAKRGLQEYAEACMSRKRSDSLIPLSVTMHRWVLIVAAHICYAEHKPMLSHALLQKLQKLQPNLQLDACEKQLMADVQNFQSIDENSILSQLFGQLDQKPSYEGVLESLNQQQREPLEKLLQLIGLQRQKDLGVELFFAAQDQEFLRENGMAESVVDRVQNFVFAGNPGCGKTIVARLYADILHKSGIRNGSTFIEMTGANALKMGPTKFAEEMKKLAADRSKTGPNPADLPADRFLVNERVEVILGQMNGKSANAKIIATPSSKVLAPNEPRTYDVEFEDGTQDSVLPSSIKRPIAGQKQGGVLFIDDVYDLDPANNPNGKLILAEIMRIAEDYRDTVSVILAGYKDDIDNKIFSFNIGMASRFETVYFDDFNCDELETIWKSLCREKRYIVGDDVSAVVRRRLSKQSGKKGFGNARAVRECFESAALHAMHRYRKDRLSGNEVELRIMMHDVIGQRPDPSTNAKLGAALTELDNLVGVPEVKKSIRAIVEAMLCNYDKELQAQETDAICLNRVFVGNPGTGKTTVAKLYARILCAAGMLSKDDVVERTASDFMGVAVGESAQKTVNILKLSEGKVLVIDEAYNLFDSQSKSSGNASHGKQVLDTLVEKVSGSPGEDRAIIMIGYEHEMQEMFRGSNPGLSRRFDSNHPWQFTDFSDDDLLQVAVDHLGSRANVVPLDVYMHMVKKVSAMRMLHNFGNAGLIKTAVASALERRNMRLESAKARNIFQTQFVTIEDVDGYTEDKRKLFDDPMSVLEDLADVGNFKSQMRELQLVVSERRAQARPLAPLLKNWTFLGQPGTGKTTVALKMAALLHSFGLLPTDRVVVTSALDLTGEFMGQSKSKMQEKMDEARGGVLIIDEAYELGVGSYGNEVMTKLVQLLTDERYQHKMVVILAGYPDKMAAMFTKNAGLKSRFTESLMFEDWTSEQLSDTVIADLKKRTPAYAFDDEVDVKRELSSGFDLIRTNDPQSWANARDGFALQDLLIKAFDCRAARSRIGGRDPDAFAPSVSADDAREAVRIFLSRRPRPLTSSPHLNLSIVSDGDHGREQADSVNLQPVRVSVYEEHAPAAARGSGGAHPDEGEVDISDITNCFDSTIRDIETHIEQMDPNDPHQKAARAELRRLKCLKLDLIEKEKERQRLLALQKAAEEAAERKRLQDAADKLEREKQSKLAQESQSQQLNEKLRMVGNCPAGFAWKREGNGYRCEGGNHYVSDGQLH